MSEIDFASTRDRVATSAHASPSSPAPASMPLPSSTSNPSRATAWRRAGVTRKSMNLARAAAALFAAATLVACGASTPDATNNGAAIDTTNPVDTSEAVVHGAPDGSRHPAVLALIIEDPAGTMLCSGTLIDPEWVLTARHCVTKLKSETVTCKSSGGKAASDDDTFVDESTGLEAPLSSLESGSIGPLRSAGSFHVISGDDVKGGTEIAIGEAIKVPATGALCGSDVALLHLDREVTTITPVVLATTAPTASTTLQVVGFGMTASTGNAGAKTFLDDLAIESIAKSEIVLGTSTCSGDSGGPALDDATGDLVGVTSRGSVPCDAPDAHDIFTRVDAFRTFIEETISSTGHKTGGDAGVSGGAGVPSDLGTPCTSGKTCSTGICEGKKGAQVCSKACGGKNGFCPKDWRCAKKTTTSGAVCAPKAAAK